MTAINYLSAPPYHSHSYVPPAPLPPLHSPPQGSHILHRAAGGHSARLLQYIIHMGFETHWCHPFGRVVYGLHFLCHSVNRAAHLRNETSPSSTNSYDLSTFQSIAIFESANPLIHGFGIGILPSPSPPSPLNGPSSLSRRMPLLLQLVHFIRPSIHLAIRNSHSHSH